MRSFDFGPLCMRLPLQTPFLAEGKGSRLVPLNGVPWYYCMFGHCATHAVGVYVVTQNIWLALTELVLHWFIDDAKCRKWTSIHLDQMLHVWCKLLYVAILMKQGVLA